jgi:benzil reductase ((S)-benzoin forming)
MGELYENEGMNLYIITGTTRGIGAALAEVVARSAQNELIALARAPEGAIPGGFRIEVDVGDAAALDAAFDRVVARIRGKRYEKAVLINNAGVVGPVGPLEAVDSEEVRRNLAVNLVAPILLMRRFLLATDGAASLRRIVNISSGAGRRPIFGWTAYCAAKAGLDMASRVVALEAERRGLPIEAVSLAPGVIETGMQVHIRSLPAETFADVEYFRHLKESGELRDPMDVAEEIVKVECDGKLRGDALLDLNALGQ